MKKGQSYVSRGVMPTTPAAEAAEEVAYEYTPEPTAAWPEQFLPRDYGVNPSGRGAYEVRTMTDAFAAQLKRFKAELLTPNLELQAARRALSEICANRSPESQPMILAFEKRVVTIGIRFASEAFEVSRFIVPQLRKKLSTYGYLTFNIKVVQV